MGHIQRLRAANPMLARCWNRNVGVVVPQRHKPDIDGAQIAARRKHSNPVM
jgi:hypothetical protein